MSVSVAIVGSGPAGCFMADALVRKLPASCIDVLDRLPSPFGLVRGGVAPDHQGTKAVARQFERLFQRPEIAFLGNVSVGADVSLSELRSMYDIVVLAVGAPQDRRLGIDGENLPGVYGSGAFVGWYNGHPDHSALCPLLDRPGVAVIGNGNVALDVARILAKTPAELASSDLPAHAAARLAAADIRDIWIIGRRGPAETGFAPAELGELGRLERAAPLVEADDVASGEGKVPSLLRSYVGMPPKPVRIRFLFHAAPVAIRGGDRVERLHLARTRVVGGRAVLTDQSLEISVGTVITAIGYTTSPFGDLAMAGGTIRNEDGMIGPGLYATGWCRRGSQGTIPANRADAFALADRIATVATEGQPGGPALRRLLSERGVRWVEFSDWQRIAAAEAARAPGERPREKFVTVAEMLATLSS